MRKVYLLSCWLIFLQIVHAQIPKGAIAPEDLAFNSIYFTRIIPTVTGKILNLSQRELKKLVISYTVVTPFSQAQVKKTVLPRSDGTFKLKLDYAFPYQQIWFEIGDLFYASLYANNDLYLELDIQKIKAGKGLEFNGPGVRYLGSDGPLNVYLNNYVLYRRSEQSRLSGQLDLLRPVSSAIIDFTMKEYDKLSDSLKMIENSYIADNPSPYSWILENERISEYFARLCVWYVGKNMDETLWQKIKQHKIYLISNSSMSLFSSLNFYIKLLPDDLNHPNWKDVALLKDLDIIEKNAIDSLMSSEKLKPTYPYTIENIKLWTAQLAPRIQKLTLLSRLDKNIQTADSLFPFAKSDFLKLQMPASKDVSEQMLELEKIILSMHTGWCKTVLKREYENTISKLNEINKTLTKSPTSTKKLKGFGSPIFETSFGAQLYKVSGIKALDFLTRLKQSFPGKALIIDRWATWCVPCLAEMPHSKELQEESIDLPVVFVYLCTINRSTEAKWKSKVAELKQPGIHFLIDEALDVDLSKYFSFNGYPGYAFIDKGGNYKPGVFEWMSEIKNRAQLAALVGQ